MLLDATAWWDTILDDMLAQARRDKDPVGVREIQKQQEANRRLRRKALQDNRRENS